MTEQMLEKVALAMCCATPCEGCSGNGEGGCFDLALWEREARAAIAAYERLREAEIERLTTLLHNCGVCEKCGGFHYGAAGDCSGPPFPSRLPPHVRWMQG